jgi:hypothetical protein
MTNISTKDIEKKTEEPIKNDKQVENSNLECVMVRPNNIVVNHVYEWTTVGRLWFVSFPIRLIEWGCNAYKVKLPQDRFYSKQMSLFLHKNIRPSPDVIIVDYTTRVHQMLAERRKWSQS